MWMMICFMRHILMKCWTLSHGVNLNFIHSCYEYVHKHAFLDSNTDGQAHFARLRLTNWIKLNSVSIFPCRHLIRQRYIDPVVFAVKANRHKTALHPSFIHTYNIHSDHTNTASVYGQLQRNKHCTDIYRVIWPHNSQKMSLITFYKFEKYECWR